MGETVKYILDESRLPEAWYNIAADLPEPPAPVLHPGTGQPVGPDDLAPLFPMEVILQEVSTDERIAIPEEVREVYRQWRPTPLYRARRLERALETPARIFYKYEGVSPTGSHKPNTAVAQAFYNTREGVAGSRPRPAPASGGRRLRSPVRCSASRSTCTWSGSLRAEAVPACPHGGVRRPLRPEPVRGDRVGEAILEEHPDSTGSLGIAISEAVEQAAQRDDTKYALGSVLNHVLLHQTVIGEEAIAQMDMADANPDVLIGCTGAARTSRARVPVRRPEAPRRTRRPRDRGRAGRVPEPHARRIRLRLRRHGPPDAAREDAHARVDLRSAGFHAGGFRYHGMAPLVSHLHDLGLIEARAYHQTAVFEAGVRFARRRGSSPRRRRTTPSRRCSTRRSGARRRAAPDTILFNLCGHGHFDMQAYIDHFAGKLEDREYDEGELAMALAGLPAVAV